MNVLKTVCGRCAELVAEGIRRVKSAYMLALLFVALFGGQLLAQESGGSSALDDVPHLGIDVEVILDKVSAGLQNLMLPFIAFSIGVCLVMLIWRAGRRFAYGNS